MSQIKVHRILSFNGDYFPTMDEVILTEEEWKVIAVETCSWKFMCHEESSGYHEEFGSYSGSNTYEVKITPEKALIHEGHFYGVIVPTTGGLILVDGKQFGRSSLTSEKHTSRDDGESYGSYYLEGEISNVQYPFLLSGDGKRLLGFYEDNPGANDTITIPEGIEAIAKEAFKGKRSIGSLILPEGLKQIGEEAFKGCSLSEINLPSSLIEIGNDALRETKSLEKVIIPKGCKVGERAFWNSGLEEVEFLGEEVPIDRFYYTPYDELLKAKQETEPFKQDLEAFSTLEEGEEKLHAFLGLKYRFGCFDDIRRRLLGDDVIDTMSKIEEGYRDHFSDFDANKVLNEVILSDGLLQYGYTVDGSIRSISSTEKQILDLCNKQEGPYNYDGTNLYYSDRTSYYRLVPVLWRIIDFDGRRATVVTERIYPRPRRFDIEYHLQVAFLHGGRHGGHQIKWPSLLTLRNQWSIYPMNYSPLTSGEARKPESYCLPSGIDELRQTEFYVYPSLKFLKDNFPEWQFNSVTKFLVPVNAEFWKEHFDELDEYEKNIHEEFGHYPYLETNYYRVYGIIDLSFLEPEQTKHLNELVVLRKQYEDMAYFHYEGGDTFQMGIYPQSEFVPAKAEEEQAVAHSPKKEGMCPLLGKMLYRHDDKLYEFKPLTWKILKEEGNELHAVLETPIDPSFFLGDCSNYYYFVDLRNFLNNLFAQFTILHSRAIVDVRTEKEARVLLNEETIEGKGPFLVRPFLTFVYPKKS